MIRPILVLPDAWLRQTTRAVRLPNPEVDQLIDDLFATMRSRRGLGLAAPQVGQDIRLAVVDVEGDRLVLINPEIVARDGIQYGWEGCLSVPNRVASVDRPNDVTVSTLDLNGNRTRYRRTGLTARAILHEVDHLDGRLYIDLVEPSALIDVRDQPVPPPPPERAADRHGDEVSP